MINFSLNFSLKSFDKYLSFSMANTFFGLSFRLRQLIDNHLSALNRIEEKLKEGHFTAVDMFHPIFKRNIDETEYGLALAEAVGHLNYFRVRNLVDTSVREDGALLFTLK